MAAPPAWAAAGEPPPAPLVGPMHNLHDDGLVDLGPDGQALLCRASAVNLHLRSQPEQQALIAAFARLLHAVTGPVTVVVRSDRVDLATTVAALRAAAPGLPHPALERAAGEHADFLADLAVRRDVLSRERLLVLREPPAPRSRRPRLPAAPSRPPRCWPPPGSPSPLDQDAAARVLACAADPHAPPRPAGQATSGAVITGRRR
jgi:hypothetical protein